MLKMKENTLCALDWQGTIIIGKVRGEVGGVVVAVDQSM